MTLPQKSAKTQKIDETITKVDWGSTSRFEREAFSMSMLTLELASQAKKLTNAITKARFSSLLICLILTGTLMLLSVDHGVILGVTLCAQMFLLGMSQLLEYGADLLFKRSEKSAQDFVENLAQKHPSKDGDEDLFIL